MPGQGGRVRKPCRRGLGRLGRGKEFALQLITSKPKNWIEGADQKNGKLAEMDRDEGGV